MMQKKTPVYVWEARRTNSGQHCVTLGSHQVPRWKHSHQVPRWHQALYLGAIRCISIDPSLALHHPTPSTLHSGGSLDHPVETGRKRGNRETVVETVVETVGKVLETMESLLY